MESLVAVPVIQTAPTAVNGLNNLNGDASITVQNMVEVLGGSSTLLKQVNYIDPSGFKHQYNQEALRFSEGMQLLCDSATSWNSTFSEVEPVFLIHKRCPLGNHVSSCSNYQLRKSAGNATSLYGALSQSSNRESSVKNCQLQEHTNCQDGFVCSGYLLPMLERCIVEKDLAQGKETHFSIIQSGLDADAVLGSRLIRMYSLCDNLNEANQVFLKLGEPNLFAWTAIISAYGRVGLHDEAIALYHQMRNASVKPDGHVFVVVLKACASTMDIIQSKLIHAHVLESGLESSAFVSTALIDMYSKCGSIQHSYRTFARLRHQNMVMWNALLTGFAQHGHGYKALELFECMQSDGIEADRVTFLSILKACSSVIALDHGRRVHGHILENGYDSDVSVRNTLIDMYAKCGSLKDAQLLFEKSCTHDVVTWTSLIDGYAQHGESREALHLFQKMRHEGISPNQVTFVCIINACTSISALEAGKHVHICAAECGYESDTRVNSALIDMYAKCGDLLDAEMMFKRFSNQNCVTWNSLISGYAQHGLSQEALQLFQSMQQHYIVPDEVTFSCIMKACSSKPYFEHGKQVHTSIILHGLEVDAYVSNTLIDMYVKCESLENAQTVFDRLVERDVVTWSILIAGYVQNGDSQVAFKLFQEMQQEGTEPNQVTFVSIIRACSSLAALEHGESIHASIIDYGFDNDRCIGSALIDMYAKCGSLQAAHRVFDRLHLQDVVVWSALIGGHAYHNDYKLALKYFTSMQQAGFDPDEVTFLCLLSACNHAGAVDEGFHHFKLMREVYSVLPALEHYVCLVDLVGHVGYLDVAEDLLETAPFQYNIAGWKSLLSACRRYVDVQRGKRCFDYSLQIEPGDAAGYMVMSSIYAYAGLQQEAENLEEVRRCASAWKKPAKAFIEVGSQVHTFTVGDKTHMLSDRIYAKLRELSL